MCWSASFPASSSARSPRTNPRQSANSEGGLPAAFFSSVKSGYDRLAGVAVPGRLDYMEANELSPDALSARLPR
ncbi:hypothetical protein MPLDJ20_60091 [Mesorhizobium plurifarium]|uniref:Uncharacterized protein n=1 Tax=Mesorhizobium plurifarium TaxID=69974 RepID=A0A090FMV5_MESPL|nr:hypothetical protein MPLDJ20_60091 [Mesorhizobium plurifarium]